MISVSDSNIDIPACFFTGQESGFSEFHKDLLSDIFANTYTGQKITVNAGDGENIERCGLVEYLEWACQEFDIAQSSIHIITPNRKLNSNFVNCVISLLIFKSAKQHIIGPFERQANAKFVGTSIGRFAPARFRLVYELDQAFINDSFLIFQPRLNLVKNFYASTKNIYKKELSWIESKKFDIDVDLGVNRMHWKDSYNNYHNIWNKFDIEIVAETDPHSNYWFTEKTARCIVTGKPFLLLAGNGSLKALQNFGFKTFSDVLDETYDNEVVPTRRINKMIASLNELYTSPDRDQKIDQLYEIAKHNITHYEEIHSKI
jgi:hypothetical protein